MNKTTALDNLLALFALALLCVLIVLLSGCSTPADLAKSTLTFKGPKHGFTFESPKEVKIRRLAIGEVVLEGYESTVDATAVNAQTKATAAQMDMFRMGFESAQAAFAAYLKGQSGGMSTPQAPALNSPMTRSQVQESINRTAPPTTSDE